MRRIYQLVHTLSYGDAISGEVLSLKRCFEEAGCESLIYAINVHPKLKNVALNFKDFDAGFDGEVVLHYSLGSPLNELYLNLPKATKSLIYHNLTPARWFAGVNPRICRDIESGLNELPALLEVTDRVIADSAFNAEELNALGFKANVLNLPIDPARWDLEANSGISSILSGDPGLHLLHVGRLAPNKCIEDIIRAFYFLHHHLNPQSKLWLVGIDIDTELYSFSLKRLVNELKLDQAVNFVGCLADSEVKALYQSASVYLCLSEHEGFCLPVIEAMHFGLPVVAYNSSALPDTVADGGIIIDDKDPAKLAELVNHIHQDQALRARLIEAGKKRVQQLSYKNFATALGKLFALADINASNG